MTNGEIPYHFCCHVVFAFDVIVWRNDELVMKMELDNHFYESELIAFSSIVITCVHRDCCWAQRKKRREREKKANEMKRLMEKECNK